MKATLSLALTLLVAAAAGRELLTNGDFELPADSGWQAYAWGDFPDTGNCRLRRLHTLDEDRDFEVMLHKMLHRGFRLYQRVDVPSVDVGFSVSCRLTSKTESEPYYAAAAVCLEYLDGKDSILGETRIYSATSGCNWSSGPTLHLIRAPDSLSWHDYSFNLVDELANLPGVEPESIRAVTVSLLDYVEGNS